MARFNSLQDCAQTAHDIQNACNFTGILYTFAEVCSCMRECGITGDALNTHPVTIAFLDKLNALAGIQQVGYDHIMKAHDEVDALCQK